MLIGDKRAFFLKNSFGVGNLIPGRGNQAITIRRQKRDSASLP